MAIRSAIGSSTEVKGHLAGQEVAQHALAGLSRERAAFGILISSYNYPIQEVLEGANEILGNVPLLGCSTSGVLTAQGCSHRSVILALIAGENISVNAGWWSGFARDSRGCVQNMLRSLQPEPNGSQSMLVVADGFNGDAQILCSELSDIELRLGGCMASGDLKSGKTYQVGGRQSGNSGLAAALLGGNILIGVGADHGWKPVGAMARLTDVNGFWVRAIDDQPASETYARLFGFGVRDWSHSPLRELVRIYPLGIKNKDGNNLIIRSPLRVEVDGSLRMSSALPRDQVVDIMVGSYRACLQSVRRATQMALDDLGPTQPRLALVFVDSAWEMAFENNPGWEIQVVREVLGDETHVMGAYTLGQIARNKTTGSADFLNQHVEVILFGEKAIEI